MKPQTLEQIFRNLCEDYASKENLLGISVVSDQKECKASFLYRLIKVELVYVKKETMLVPPSTLYSRIYLHKKGEFALQLPELFSLLGIEEYRTCYFPYIETEERMKSCFERLTEILKTYVPVFEQIMLEEQGQELAEAWLREVARTQVRPYAELASILKEGVRNVYHRRLLLVHNDFLVNRYTGLSAYDSFLRGDQNKALAQYNKQEKKGHLQLYEMQLREFLYSPASDDFVPIPEACFAKKDMRRLTGGWANLLSWLKCFDLLWLFSGLLFSGLFLLLAFFGKAGALCWFGPEWWCGALVGAVPAFFGVLAFRRKLTLLLEPKTAEAQLAFDDIMNTERADKWTRRFFVLAAAAAIIFSIFISHLSLRLYEDRGDYGIEMPFLKRVEFSYENIEAVYRIDARYNDYDELIKRASYVILLKDGSQVDFDSYTSLVRTEEEALPIFREAGIPIFEVKTDRDIPVP